MAGAAILVVAGVVAWLLRPRDEPTHTSVGDAVASFRHADPSGGDDLAGPPAGVYRYATRGGESAESAINSTSHDYGGISTIVLRPGRCGELERWQVLAERWTETEFCPGAHGERLAGGREYHEFYGIQQEDRLRCSGNSGTDLARARPGFRFSNTCHSDDFSVHNSSRLIGPTRVRVGGKTYPAFHTVTSSHIEGSTSGISRREDWRRRSDGLLLRRTAQSSAESGLAGGVDYTESYTLRLLDTEPRR